MSSQGPSRRGAADDSWWDEVYRGPAGPGTGAPEPTPGTVDDWFDSATRMITDRDGGAGPPDAAPPDAVSPDGPGSTAGSGTAGSADATVDDWFTSASAVIGGPAEARAPGAAVLRTGAERRPGSVDDWFDSANDAITDRLTSTPPVSVSLTKPATPRVRPGTGEPPEPPPHSAECTAKALVEPPAGEAPQPSATGEAPPPSAPAPSPAAGRPLVPRPGRPPDTGGSGGQADAGPAAVEPAAAPGRPLPYVGGRPPTYDPDPTALPSADPEGLPALVPDTAVDGARYGALTLRAASVRGDSSRFRGEPRRDHLLVTRFGTGRDALLLAVVASPPRPLGLVPGRELPGEACRRLAAAVGRSRAELLTDLREGAQQRVRYGLQRFAALAVRHLPEPPAPEPEPDGAEGPGPAVADAVTAASVRPAPAAPPTPTRAAGLHALLVPLDPALRLRIGFGCGPGGLLLHRPPAGGGAGRAGGWAEVYPAWEQPAEPAGFRFRAVESRPGDVLLLCSAGLAEPLHAEPAAARFLAGCWGAGRGAPGMVDFLREMQVRVKGHAEDRTAAVFWDS